MRQFKLINSKGQSFDLMRKDAFFESPDGLGISRNQKFAQIQDYSVLLDDTAKQKAPNGEMVFLGYAQYKEFSAFIALTPLTLCYKALPGEEWAYLDCYVSDFKLSEKDFSKHLIYCPISFQGLGPWYAQTIVSEIETATPDVLPLTLPFVLAKADKGSARLRNRRSEAACRLVIGESVNPSWTLKQGEKTVSSGKVNITVASGETLVVDSTRPDTMEIALYSASGTRTDKYQYRDFSKECFLYLPPGDCVLSFSHDGTNVIQAQIEVRAYFDTI